MSRRYGFTLFEMAIVIVIIALLVAAIYTGADMLKASQIRKTISQLSQTQTALQAFRGKYGQWPGDFNDASSFWPEAVNGDNNGRIESNSAGSIYEDYNAWHHLSQAQLIDSQFVPVTANPATTDYSVVPAVTLEKQYLHVFYTTGGGTYLPKATYLALYSYPRSLPLANSQTLLVMAAHRGMYPADAFNLDTKLDDGLPFSGIAGPQLSTPLLCTDPDGENVYVFSGAQRDCSFFIRFVF
ncbi:MAG: type II secretion system GspH family protein [Pirellulales bacterium]|nr:type II secretion system GspH family protein [Pirellulales bacterium]